MITALYKCFSYLLTTTSSRQALAAEEEHNLDSRPLRLVHEVAVVRASERQLQLSLRHLTVHFRPQRSDHTDQPTLSLDTHSHRIIVIYYCTVSTAAKD